MEYRDRIRNQMNELLYTISGMQMYVSPFLETNHSADLDKFNSVSKEMALLAIPQIPEYELSDRYCYLEMKPDTKTYHDYSPYLRELCEHYYYLALSVCFFFENHPDLELKTRWIAGSKFSFRSIRNLSKDLHFDSYLYFKNRADYASFEEYRIGSIKKHDETAIKSHSMMKACDSLEDYLWYESKWTDQDEYFEGYNDALRLFYLLCNSILKRGIVPSAGKTALYPKEKPGGIMPKNTDWEEDFYSDPDYIFFSDNEEEREMRIAEYIKERKSCSNENCIQELSEKIGEFPFPKKFLNHFIRFRELFLNIRLRTELPDAVNNGVIFFLEKKNVSLYTNEEKLSTISRHLYALTRMAKDYQNEIIEDITENGKTAKA